MNRLVVPVTVPVPVILFVRDELLWCGVGVTATLIVGAFVVNWKNRRSGEGDQ